MVTDNSPHQRVLYPYQAGRQWSALVERVMSLHPADPMRIALALTVDRHNRSLPPGSEKLHADCPECAARLLAEFGGSEQELIRLFYRHVAEVKRTILKMGSHRRKLVA